MENASLVIPIIPRISPNVHHIHTGIVHRWQKHSHTGSTPIIPWFWGMNIHISTYIYIHKYIYIYVYVYIYIYTYLSLYIYIYISHILVFTLGFHLDRFIKLLPLYQVGELPLPHCAPIIFPIDKPPFFMAKPPFFMAKPSYFTMKPPFFYGDSAMFPPKRCRTSELPHLVHL